MKYKNIDNAYGKYFIFQVRDVLRYIKENPFPDVTLFPDNQPHYFRRDRLGCWVLAAELSNNNNGTPDANIVNSISVMASAAAAISPPTPTQTAVVTGGNATISVPAVPSTPASAAWTPPISSTTAPPSAAQAPPLQAHPILHAAPNVNVTPQQQQQQQQQPPQQQQQLPPQSVPALWGSTTPSHGAPPRYGPLHLDCKLKTHLAGSVAPTPHYEDHLINAKPERFMQTWQTSQL